MRGLALVLLLLVHRLAAAQAGLAHLEIEIWPEYDRAGTALVILNAELAPDVALPATLSMRVPKASGGPSAVAETARPESGLFNVQYTTQASGEYILVNFKAQQRFFHVEFYEPLGTQTPERRFTYTWPGDFAAARASVLVQEPAGATPLSVKPDLPANLTGQNGLRYRSGELGALAAGKPLTIEVGYQKSDARPSVEILGLKPAAQAPAPAVPAAPPPPARSELPAWVYGAATALVVILLAGAFVFWYERRGRPAAPKPQAAVPPPAPTVKSAKSRRRKKRKRSTPPPA